MMALTQLVPCSPEKLLFFSTFLHPSIPLEVRRYNLSTKTGSKKLGSLSLDISCSAHKIVPSPTLERHVVKQNIVRFVQKLKTLLLSKPKHYIPIQILSKCRSYLGIENPRAILSMIRRYHGFDDEYEDGFENFFDSEDSGVEYHFDEEVDDKARVSGETVEYWSRKLLSSGSNSDETKSVIDSW